MAEFPLKEAVRGRTVDVIWMPFELRPYPTPTLRPEGSYLQSAWQNAVYPLAQRLGVPIRLPAVSPQPYTHLAFEGLELAKDNGAGEEYNSAVMRAFFQNSLDIGDPEVLVGIALEAGLPPDLFRAALQKHTYAERVDRLLRHAYEEVRVTGVPLFLIGDERLSGVQPRSALEAAIERQSERSDNPPS